VTPPEKDTIEVTGTGQAHGTPDRVLLDLRIHAERPSVAEALAALQRAMSAVLSVAEEAGRSSAPPRTQGMSVHPQHDPQGQHVVGYTAAQQLRLTFAGTDLAGESIAALSAAAGDALGIDSVSLALSDPSTLLDRAREAAFNDAQHRAGQYARLAGRSLGTVRAVRDAPLADQPEPRMFRMAAADSGGVPLAAGEHTVTASVTVRWDLA
jgi:hypothetical protein